MIFKKTELGGAWIIDVEKREDSRGFFARSFCAREFSERGLNADIAQVNVSYNSTKHTLRGMHYQQAPHCEVKLVRCIRGALFDVIIDLRGGSPTYKKWLGVELTEGTHRMLYVPERFAHGFMTLEDNTELLYQVSNSYTPEAEKGLRWDDPAIDIKWPAEPAVLSEKDGNWSFLV